MWSQHQYSERKIPIKQARLPSCSSWESFCGLQKGGNFWDWWEQKEGHCIDKAWFLFCSSPPASTQVLSACRAHRGSPWDESAVVQHSVCDWMDECNLGQMSWTPHGPKFCHILQSSFAHNNTDTVNPICSCIYFSVGTDLVKEWDPHPSFTLSGVNSPGKKNPEELRAVIQDASSSTLVWVYTNIPINYKFSSC